jgi:hypothetical protein
MRRVGGRDASVGGGEDNPAAIRPRHGEVDFGAMLVYT